jgi:aminocarboxymuconate-semialdehyde decarboxylase
LERVVTIIDVHAHLFPPAWRPRGRMPADMFDVERQLERMESGGIETCVISDPHIWYGDLDLGDISQARVYNDFVADLAREHRQAFVGLATVTPWRGAEHLAEARRAVEEAGLAGFAVATSDRGRYFDSVPAEFWELAGGLGVPVFVHPGGDVVGDHLYTSYRLGEVCGRPLDMTVTLARFILFGVGERFPDLRLLCAHGGGGICTIADRLDFGHELRNYAPLGPWGEVELAEPPSHHVARLYLDTVTYGPRPLRLALDTVGVERICFGTDGPPVPFDVRRHLDVVEALGLTEHEQAAVLSGNARRLLSIAS